MSSNAVFKKSLLAVAVAISVSSYPAAVLAECSPDTPEGAICETIKLPMDNGYTNTKEIYVKNGHGVLYSSGSVASGKHFFTQKDINVSGVGAHGIYVAADATANNLNITKGSSVISQNDTAIKIDGSIHQAAPDKPNYGIMLIDKGTISGAINAIDFSESSSNMRIDISGTIKGNIIGNSIAGNRILFGYQTGNNEAVFDGLKIDGIETIENYGLLSIKGQQETIV